MNGGHDPRTSPSPASVAVGIIFALEIESDGLAALATDRVALRTARGATIHTGTVAGLPVAWTAGGTGVEAARRAAETLVAGHRPAWLVSAGFAGAMVSGFDRGATVIVTRSLRAGAPEVELVDPSAMTGLRGAAVTVDAPVSDPAEKRALAAATGAALVEMETHAVAALAAACGLPCAGLRVVSDAVDDRLPREVADLSRPQSPWRRLGRAVRAVGSRPAAAADLWRLWERAVVDSRTLGHALERLCAASRPR